MPSFTGDLFVSFVPADQTGAGHVFRGRCCLDGDCLTITLDLPDGSTLSRSHHRDTPLPVILDSLRCRPTQAPPP